MLTMMLVAALQAATPAPAPAPAVVAEAVETEFPRNDKDMNGRLSRAEFAAWMVRLKAQSDPSTRPDAPATQAWVASAWRLADRDRSAGVTRAELTGFFSGTT
jgi:hypothetical protein